jgi:hypothetical protein
MKLGEAGRGVDTVEETIGRWPIGILAPECGKSYHREWWKIFTPPQDVAFFGEEHNGDVRWQL